MGIKLLLIGLMFLLSIFTVTALDTDTCSFGDADGDCAITASDLMSLNIWGTPLTLDVDGDGAFTSSDETQIKNFYKYLPYIFDGKPTEIIVNILNPDWDNSFDVGDVINVEVIVVDIDGTPRPMIGVQFFSSSTSVMELSSNYDITDLDGKIYLTGEMLSEGNTIFTAHMDGDSIKGIDSIDFSWPVIIYPVNNAPGANAGSDQSVNTNSLVTLDGSLSSDPNLDPITYLWTQTSGPTIILSDNSITNPTFTPTQDGTYTFDLTVSDGVLESIDSVIITSSTPSTPPSGGGGGGGGGGGSNHEYTNIATPITPVIAPTIPTPTVTPAPVAPATAPATATAPLTTGAAIVDLVKSNPVSAGIVCLLVLAVIIGAVYYFKKK